METICLEALQEGKANNQEILSYVATRTIFEIPKFQLFLYKEEEANCICIRCLRIGT